MKAAIPEDPLSLFHPTIQAWFRERVGKPTDVQRLVWPEIASNRHVLATAPTGSGKTLAAFLWPINQLLVGAWPVGMLRVLYVSPLRALNNDIRQNLIAPLEELQSRFEAAGLDWPDIRVQTRSGDTPESERRRMRRRPPEFLITTPESLNILISSQSGRQMLSSVSMVILDEIHAVAESKRGTHLMTAVERLVPLTGEFQRVAISATVKPLETIADFVGGFVLRGQKGNRSFKKRKVRIVEASGGKVYDLRVMSPSFRDAYSCCDVVQNTSSDVGDKSYWKKLAAELKPIIAKNRSTLIFTNSRRLAEKIARFINLGEPQDVAYAHHGSLSKEIRLIVEQRLKNGELGAIVSTSSLELGIDIGPLDEVILVSTPASVASALQRVGRAGHSVGAVSRGKLYATNGGDLVEAAVLTRALLAGEIENAVIVSSPLDVLAQVLLAMTSMETWDLDELYDFIRTCASYHDLSRRQFDLVIEMLAGRYADARIRELRPRLSVDRIANSVSGKPGALRLIYFSGGTIPDRGYYNLRLMDTKAKIGELDEEFVWERRLGDTFTLGARTWRINRITHNDVEVLPTDAPPSIIPFWRAEQRSRGFHLSEKIGLFLEDLNGRLKDAALPNELVRDYSLDPEAAQRLVEHLQRQRDATKSDLPHRRHLLIEHFSDPLNMSASKQVILHTIWGGKVNGPCAMALAAAWLRKYGERIEVFHGNDCILLLLPHSFEAEQILDLVTPENFHEMLHEHLSETGFFGAHFRENAARALLLPKAGFKKRMPLWLNRLRAKKLLEAVSGHKDFPIVLETWRSCLNDEFDLDSLAKLLDELRTGEIRISQAYTKTASPFTDGLVWQSTNKYMYEDDSPSAKGGSLSAELLREIVHSEALRPQIDPHLAEELEQKLKRTAPDYAPATARDLVDWVKERLLIPAAEWEELVYAMERDAKTGGSEIPAEILPKILGQASSRIVKISGGAACAMENLPRLKIALKLDLDVEELSAVGNGQLSQEAKTDVEGWLKEKRIASDADSAADFQAFLGQWLEFHGPRTIPWISDALGVAPDRVEEAVEQLVEDGVLVAGRLLKDAKNFQGGIQICDAQNLEILLRMARTAQRPRFEPLEIEKLPLFLATRQGVVNQGNCLEDLQERLEKLLCCPQQVRAWEEWILPARLSPYFTSWMDALMAESDLMWVGRGREKAAFAFPEDLILMGNGDESADSEEYEFDQLDEYVKGRRRFTFEEVLAAVGIRSAELTRRLWNKTWKGEITLASMSELRKGIRNKFKASELAPLDKSRGRRPSRSAFNRWKSARPFSGDWIVLNGYGENGAGDDPSDASDPLEALERSKDIVRLLLDRCGVLFREVLEREIPEFKWGKIFRTLRLMELSGEIVSGCFFKGIQGLQFASHGAVRELGHALAEDAVYWLNATDPASCCGFKIPEFKSSLPKRLASTFIVYYGSNPAIILLSGGKKVEIRLPPDHAALRRCMEIFKQLLGREFNPVGAIEVETINGEPAVSSQYLGAFLSFGFEREFKAIVLRKNFHC